MPKPSFDEVYRNHVAMFRRLANLTCTTYGIKCPAAVAEVYSMVLVRAWRCWLRWDPEKAKFSTYIYHSWKYEARRILPKLRPAGIRDAMELPISSRSEFDEHLEAPTIERDYDLHDLQQLAQRSGVTPGEQVALQEVLEGIPEPCPRKRHNRQTLAGYAKRKIRKAVESEGVRLKRPARWVRRGGRA